MILIISSITVLYSLLILAFIIGFKRVENFKATTNNSIQTAFSIIIPFRNEAEELPDLLESITQLEYLKSHYEIIFVDDASNDDSVDIIKKYCNKLSMTFSILQNNRKTNSPKKDAINTAIQRAQYNWIITTDADCILPKKWLQTFDSFIQHKQPKFIVAPVTYVANSNFLQQFQLLDFLSLQGSTIGSFGIKKPFLCNGANLCYRKDTFFEVNGFEENTHIASGDDIFLLEKIVKKYPSEVHYLKSSMVIVRTKPQPTLKQLLNQRIRWAAKSTAYTNTFSKLVSSLVFLMNFLLIILFFNSVFGLISWQFSVLIFGIKLTIDLLLLIKTTVFFKQQKVLRLYFLSSLVYPVFIMLVVIASLKSGYDWKGRQFKK